MNSELYGQRDSEERSMIMEAKETDWSDLIQ